VDHLEDATRYDRKNAEAHYRLGNSYLVLHEDRKAAKALTQATQLAGGEEPWLMKAYLDLGYLQRDRGKKSEAVRAFQAYIDMGPKESNQVDEVKMFLLQLRGN
jgi:TolA-binding protein